MQSSDQTALSIGVPVASGSPVLRKLRRLSSSRSMPSALAISSICCSWAMQAWAAPKPRNALVYMLLVATARASTRRLSTR